MSLRKSNETGHLPKNLYSKMKNGKRYFQYKHPVTGKFHGVGSDESEAIRVAEEANKKLAQPPKDYLSEILG